MPRVHANGIDIYYETRGSGVPLLLIAGFACDSTIWSKVASPLARHYRVIAFDNRGVGRSSAPDAPYSLRQMAEDAVGLLDVLGVTEVHVAGHSMGGQIAQELAIGWPDRVRSLQLIATSARNDERSRAIVESWGALPRQVDPATAARLSLPWIYTPRFYARPGAIAQIIELIAANPFPPPAHGIYHQSRAISQFDATDRIAAIRCPVAVLAGREDILLPVAHAEALARALPDAALTILEETGHGLLIETPEAVARAMLAFLAKHAVT